MSLLRCERLNAFYGKSHILSDATLNCASEVVALLGRNGPESPHS